MRSASKRRLTPDEIRVLLCDALGPVEVTDCSEFTDGWFSSVYGVNFASGQELVLKLAPSRDTKVLR